MDSTSLPDPAGGFADAVRNAGNALKGLRVGLPKEYFSGSGLSAGVEAVMQQAIARIKALGAEPVEVSLPHTKYAVAVYYIIATAEASANLARFDGIRYGDRKEGRDLVDTYFKTRGEGFGNEVKRRILLGTYVLSSGYYDAYYLRAQKVRTLIRRDFEEAFRQCDVMLAPTTPMSPPGRTPPPACRLESSSSRPPSRKRSCCRSPTASSGHKTVRFSAGKKGLPFFPALFFGNQSPFWYILLHDKVGKRGAFRPVFYYTYMQKTTRRTRQ